MLEKHYTQFLRLANPTLKLNVKIHPPWDCSFTWNTHLRSWRYPPLREFDVFRLWLVSRHRDIFDSQAGKLQEFVHSGGAVSGC